MKRVPLDVKERVSVAEQLLEQPAGFISSGCLVLDLVMGNGYPIGRIVNIVGDKSTGKTLFAIEAMANFNKSYPYGEIHYLEAESAFDIAYAETLGFPVDTVQVIDDKETIEDLYQLMTELVNRSDTTEPCLLIVDSLDALSDKAEVDREIDAATMGTNKAAKLSTTFRKQVRKLSKAKVTVLIISQVRDNIGVTFGSKSKRSGGRALDFYASIVLYLAEKRKRPKVVKGVSRIVGIDIVAKCTKNKISSPFRECEVPIIFGYGMEEIEAGVNYLQSVKRDDVLQDLGLPRKVTKATFQKYQYDEDFKRDLNNAVRKTWKEVEGYFTVKRKKY